jgi:GntR family transcriptional repressor for pyruvate dehydrogenase complex
MSLTRDSKSRSAQADDRGLSSFRPIRIRRAADEVVAILLDAIRGGLYARGDRLPRERELAARLEVSRTTVREALRILAERGVVSIKRGNAGGIIVEKTRIPGSLLASMEGSMIVELRAVLEVRRALEVTAAVLAARRATDRELQEVEDLVTSLAGLTQDPDKFISKDFEFHASVADLTRNPILADYVREIIQRFVDIRAQYPVGHIHLEKGIENQRKTLEAIARRDEQTVLRVMDDHLGSVEEYFLGERLTSPIVAENHSSKDGRPSLEKEMP